MDGQRYAKTIAEETPEVKFCPSCYKNPFKGSRTRSERVCRGLRKKCWSREIRHAPMPHNSRLVGDKFRVALRSTHFALHPERYAARDSGCARRTMAATGQERTFVNPYA